MKKENLVKFNELEIDILASEHELSHVRGGAAIHPIMPVIKQAHSNWEESSIVAMPTTLIKP